MKPMFDLEYAKRGVASIDEVQDDPESAHSREDTLYLEFVTHVAENGPHNLAELAEEILKTQEMPFSRWCA